MDRVKLGAPKPATTASFDAVVGPFSSNVNYKPISAGEFVFVCSVLLYADVVSRSDTISSSRQRYIAVLCQEQGSPSWIDSG